MRNKAFFACILCIFACGCSRKRANPGEERVGTQAHDSGQIANRSPQNSFANAVVEHNESSGIPRDPAAVISAVQERFQSNARLKGKPIQVSFEHGIVSLRGTVENDDDLGAAGAFALSVDGVHGVANYLAAQQWRASPAEPFPQGGEAEITAVEQAIQSDPKAKGKIQVFLEPPEPTRRYTGTGDGRDGTIHLAGAVEDEDSEIAATNDVRKTTDLPIFNTMTVLHDPYDALRQGLTDSPAPAWNGPSLPDKPTISLCPGLTVVTAVAGPDGDYESIKTIESVDAKQVLLKYSAEVMQPWWETPHPQLRKTVTHRNVLPGDLQSAHNYDFNFSEKAPESAPGSTAIGASAALLGELKTKGEAEFGLCGGDDDLPMRDKDGHIHPLTAGCSVFFSRTIKRVENEPVRLRVLVNGIAVELPAVHALGEWGDVRRNEFFFLDDERNPLTLKFRMGIGRVPALSPNDRVLCANARDGAYFSFYGDDPPSCDLPDGGDRDTLRVVSITTKCSMPGAKATSDSGPGAMAALEQSLAQSGKADIYSVYFSFNSDVLREESQPTLKDIAEILRRHRDWKLRIAGHTDGIGGDEKNLDLSKRRAAAVKDALVKKYGVAASRLQTTGFGKSQPKDTNDTLEGRAHNRRVELMKIS